MVDQQRQEHRIFVRGDIYTRERQSHESAAQLIDISAHGCRVELVSRVNVGDTVWVRLPGLRPICSEVRWVDEYQAGLYFDKVIHPAILDDLIEQLSGDQ